MVLWVGSVSPGCVEVLRQAGDAAGGVVDVAAELGGGQAACGVVAAAGGKAGLEGEGPGPGDGLAQRVPGDAGDQRRAVQAQAREAAGGVVAVGEQPAVGDSRCRQGAVRVVAVADLLDAAVREGLLLQRDAAEAIAGVLGGAAAVDDLREVALAVGTQVVAQGGGLAVGEDQAGGAAQGVAGDGGGLAEGVGDLAGQAQGVVLGAGGAGVGAGSRWWRCLGRRGRRWWLRP
jgi:putative membrane protein